MRWSIYSSPSEYPLEHEALAVLTLRLFAGLNSGDIQACRIENLEQPFSAVVSTALSIQSCCRAGSREHSRGVFYLAQNLIYASLQTHQTQLYNYM